MSKQLLNGAWEADRLDRTSRDRRADLDIEVRRGKFAVALDIDSTRVGRVTRMDDGTGVRLTDGREIPCDTAVVAIGTSPNTDWLTGSGLTVDDGVVCDATLLAAPGVDVTVPFWWSDQYSAKIQFYGWSSVATHLWHRDLAERRAALLYCNDNGCLNSVLG